MTQTGKDRYEVLLSHYMHYRDYVVREFVIRPRLSLYGESGSCFVCRRSVGFFGSMFGRRHHSEHESQGDPMFRAYDLLMTKDVPRFIGRAPQHFESWTVPVYDMSVHEMSWQEALSQARAYDRWIDEEGSQPDWRGHNHYGKLDRAFGDIEKMIEAWHRDTDNFFGNVSDTLNDWHSFSREKESRRFQPEFSRYESRWTGSR